MIRQYTLSHLHCSDSDEISAQVELAPDSLWFSGHFPEDPILPGIAQLGMVLDVLEQSNHLKLNVSELSRVRFKRIVRPGDRLKIGIRPLKERPGSYSFQISVEENPACSGIMTVEQAANQEMESDSF